MLKIRLNVLLAFAKLNQIIVIDKLYALAFEDFPRLRVREKLEFPHTPPPDRSDIFYFIWFNRRVNVYLADAVGDSRNPL